MVDLIHDIDQAIETCVTGKFYGLARLLKDDKGDVYPAAYPDGAGEHRKITPQDKYKVLVYHRLLDGSPEYSEEFSFGRSLAFQNVQRVRMVVLVAFSEGEMVIDEIINAMPDFIENVDYKTVSVSGSITLIRDRESIWETEWGNAYKDKYQMRYNIYAVEYSVEYIKCEPCA